MLHWLQLKPCQEGIVAATARRSIEVMPGGNQVLCVVGVVNGARVGVVAGVGRGLR